MRIASVLFATSALVSSERALAQACQRPDLVDALPDDDAQDVPTNARPIARYRSIAEYLGESILYGAVGEEPVAVEGLFHPNEGLVELPLTEPLEPNTDYFVEWPALRGLGTASLGRGKRVIFRTGQTPDTEPPRFAGAMSVDWELDRSRDDCTDRREERFVFDLGLSPVADDGGRDSLSLIVFQTRGPEIDPETAATPISVHAYPDDDAVRIRLPIEDATGRVCFAAIARDLTGKVSASGSAEVCTDTVAPPFFQGCSVGATSSRSGTLPLLVFASLCALAVSTMRRRRPPAA